MKNSKLKSARRHRFTPRERRAIMFLLPLVAVLVLILWSAVRPRTNADDRLTGDSITELTESRSNGNESSRSSEKKLIKTSDSVAAETEKIETKLFPFDPNTATYEDFRTLGIDRGTASAIVKYRMRGKVFQIPEDFATCYGLDDSMYAILKPYIKIGDEFRLKPKQNLPVREAVAEPAATEGGIAETIPLSSNNSIDSRLRMVELNTADYAKLISVSGIGEKSASAIIAYRELLGGYHSVEQLTELDGIILEKNYERMYPYIWADSCEIRKIDINFATANTITGHPYMNDRGKLGRKILSNRQLKGGWSTIEDMVGDETLTPDEAARLAPYLRFTTVPML